MGNILFPQKYILVLPDCLGLCECQRFLHPHTFHCTSDDFHIFSPVKPLFPNLSAGNVDRSDLPASWCFLTRLDEGLLVWFYGWKSLKCVLWCPLHSFVSQTSWKSTTLKQDNNSPACTWQWLGLTMFYSKICRNSSFFLMQDLFLLYFIEVSPAWGWVE